MITMKEIAEDLIEKAGVVARDFEGMFFGRYHQCRGFYIVSPDGHWYLHRDGEARVGVYAEYSKPAFWPTEKEARDFLDQWREKRSSGDHHVSHGVSQGKLTATDPANKGF